MLMDSDIKETPLVSVITVCFNAEASLEKTLLSVLNQTYAPIQYIVIDGGSIDSTPEILKQYGAQLDVCLSEPDKGVYDAMNKGVKLAKGDWVIFLNAGDAFIDANVISRIFTGYSDNASLIVGAVRLSNGDIFYPKQMTRLRLSYSMPFCHQGMFYRRSLFERHAFDIHYKSIADNEHLFRLFDDRVIVKYIDQVVAYYDEPGISAQHFFQSWRDKFVVVVKHMPAFVPATLAVFVKALLGKIIKNLIRLFKK
jgi:glycosyltransferase involved in cell wall biosynthesis